MNPDLINRFVSDFLKLIKVDSYLPTPKGRQLTRRGFITTSALILTGCSPVPTPRLRIGTFTYIGYEPFFLARALGKLDEQRVQLLEFPSAAEALLAFKNEAIDAVTISLAEVLRLARGGHEPRIILNIDSSIGADVILAKQRIEGMQGLRNQRVGVESNSLGSFLLARALEANGMTLKDVKSISLRADRIEGAYQRGEVDAVVTYEPYASRLLARGGHRLFDSRTLNNEATDALVVRHKSIERQRANLALTVQGWFEALEYLKQNPEDAITRMAPREALTEVQFSAALKLVHLYDKAENQKLMAPENTELLDRLRTMAAFMETQAMLQSGVDVTPLRDTSLLR